jgi:hypothetical protein
MFFRFFQTGSREEMLLCILVVSPMSYQLSALCYKVPFLIVVAYAFFLVYSQVGWHPKFTDSRCFFIIRKDGTIEDFSYRKCILGALDIVDPEKSKIQKKKWSGNNDMEAKKWSGNDGMEAKKWSENYDKEAKKWSKNYDKEAKKWSGNGDMDVTVI